MSVDGVMFLLAFPLMIGLIVWVIWGVARDVKKDDPYIDKALPYLSKNDTPIVVAAKKSSPWKLTVLGIILVLIGSGFYWYWDTYFPNSSIQQRINSMGIVLGGIICIFLAFRSWRNFRKPEKAPSAAEASPTSEKSS